MSVSGHYLFALIFALAGPLGCGAAAPASRDLATARIAYAQARNSEAAQLNPGGVAEAHRELQRAEHAHAEDAGGELEKHHAYIATRIAQRAVEDAKAVMAIVERERALRRLRALCEGAAPLRAAAGSPESARDVRSTTPGALAACDRARPGHE